MFTQVIRNSESAAQRLAFSSRLPPQLEFVRANAIAFGMEQAPLLYAVSAAVGEFAGSAAATAVQLESVARAWEQGDEGARVQITDQLGALLSVVQALMGDNQGALGSLNAYRDQVLEDQRAVAQQLEEMRGRVNALRATIDLRRMELRAQQERLFVLQAVLFPVWVLTEVTRLLNSMQTTEQRLQEEQNAIFALVAESFALQDAAAGVEMFAGELQGLQGSLQTLSNAMSVAEGQMQQVVDALRNGQQGTNAIVVLAYLRTLAGQAGNLTNFLSGR